MNSPLRTRRLLIGGAASTSAMALAGALPSVARAASAKAPAVIGSMIRKASIPFCANFIKGQQVLSDEMQELLELGDRVAIVRAGAIGAEAATAALAPQQLLALMSRRTGEAQ
ncbi:MAG: hypothetical protein KGL43_13420 [Burkholderiales bacterium]|nr:hypothetical protein [Burkholderiales bacterium]MDE2454586.1 hypothetical protein [Burkholderiales bacterium]